MKAICPNDRLHKKFVTVAHVTQDWVVTETGDFIEEARGSESVVTHKPDPGNTWTCAICGAEAKVTA